MYEFDPFFHCVVCKHALDCLLLDEDCVCGGLGFQADKSKLKRYRKERKMIKKTGRIKSVNGRDKAMKPRAYTISLWKPKTEVLYCCPSCGCDFSIVGHQNLFCFQCGQKIDWKGIMINAPEEIAKEYHLDRTYSKREDELMDWINEQNHKP